MDLTRDELTRHLRDALNHLHDHDFLRYSPLAALFGLANRLDTSSALRNALIDAIESIKPGDGDPSPSRAWQMHDALYCCYVQQLSQRVVADQLAVSARQLRREQHAALEVLADHLCERFALVGSPPAGPGPAAASEQPAAAAVPADESGDLAWLKDMPPEQPTDLAEVMRSVAELVRPLADRHQVRLDTQIPEGLPKLAAHPAALSQILLSLLSMAIPQAPGLPVHIAARAVERAVEIDVQVQQFPAGAPTGPGDASCVTMARQLAEIYAGKVSISHENRYPLSLTVTLPALDRLPVLIIDDNADALQLTQRYMAGTRYRPIVTRDPEQALSMAESLAPQVIVLDVMMPQIDGWKVLGRLRQHPSTGHIPIIACTILPQEALALSLGASAFLRKPITRQALLAALDDQIARMAKAPR